MRIRAASLNYRDLLVRSGKSASGGAGPVVPLSDGAGEITATGADVTEWTVGDRVALTFFRDWIEGPFDMVHHGAARGGSCDGVTRGIRRRPGAQPRPDSLHALLRGGRDPALRRAHRHGTR